LNVIRTGKQPHPNINRFDYNQIRLWLGMLYGDRIFTHEGVFMKRVALISMAMLMILSACTQPVPEDQSTVRAANEAAQQAKEEAAAAARDARSAREEASRAAAAAQAASDRADRIFRQGQNK
jgi:hypothetical protein